MQKAIAESSEGYSGAGCSSWSICSAYGRIRDSAALALIAFLLFSYGFLGTAAHRMVLYVSAVFLVGVVWRYGRDILQANKKLAGVFLGFLAYNFISSFFNGFEGDQLFHATKTSLCIGVFVFAAAALVMRSEQNEKIMLRALIIGVALSALIAVISYGWEIYSGKAITPYRLTGFGRMARSTKMGEALAIISLILIYKKDVLPCAISRSALLLSNLAILFVTWGRGAIVGFVSSVVMMTLSRPNKAVLIGGGLVLISGVAAYFAMTDFVHMLIERGLTHRDELWARSLELIKDRPIFGYGIAHEFNFTLNAHYNAEQNSPHNLLIGALLYGGVVGLGFLLALVVMTLYKAFQLHRMRRACYPLALILFGLIVGQITGRTIFVNVNPEWLYTWLPLAMVMGLFARKDKEPENISE